MNRRIIVGVFIFFSMSMSAQSIFGKWKTIDDRTGNAKAIINIYEDDGLMYGHVVEILEEGRENAVCEKCGVGCDPFNQMDGHMKCPDCELFYTQTISYLQKGSAYSWYDNN